MTVTTSPCSFSKKYGTIMSLNQNPHQTVFCALAYQCIRASFLCLKLDNFACLQSRQDQNELNFFFTKIGIFCKSLAGLLPSVVQAYTQPYSFGGRIKLIICQIRHELSVTIHEVSTCWKKTLDGGLYILNIIYNMTSSNNNLTIKVTGSMILPLA